MILVFAVLDAAAGAYLVWRALHRRERDELGVLIVGVLLLLWGVGVVVLRGRPDALARWWSEVTGPQATLMAAVGVGLIGGVTILQKLQNDRRDQWWKRSQWAIDLALVDDERSQLIGWAAIAELSRSEPATRQDRLLFRQVVDAALDGLPDDDMEDGDQLVIEVDGDSEGVGQDDGDLDRADR